MSRIDLRALIGEFFASGTGRLFDERGEAIPPATLRREFDAIRGFLLAERVPGEVVAISLERGHRYVLCLLACMDAGVAFVPLNRRWPAARIEQIRALTGFSFMITEENIDDLCRERRGAPAPRPAPDPSQPLYIVCTSGTTGEPKGVVIARRAYESYLEWLGGRFPMLDADSRHLLLADFTFDMSLMDLALVLLKRCSLFVSRFGGNAFLLAREIETLRITSFMTVPLTVELLLHETVERKADLSSLRCLVVGGSRLPESLYRSLFQKLPRAAGGIYHAYGPTETTVITHLRRLSGNPEEECRRSRVSVGKPGEGVRCRLVGPGDAPVAGAGAPGELLLGGAQTMTGYAGRPEETRASVLELDGDRYFRSGDTAFVDESGDYYILGREDDTIKRRGFRVNLSDIDAYIKRLAAVRDSVTIALPHPSLDHVLVSCVIARRPIAEAELRRELSAVLVEHQMPDRIELMDEFPVNESGKVCRRTLAARLERRS